MVGVIHNPIILLVIIFLSTFFHIWIIFFKYKHLNQRHIYFPSFDIAHKPIIGPVFSCHCKSPCKFRAERIPFFPLMNRI